MTVDMRSDHGVIRDTPDPRDKPFVPNITRAVLPAVDLWPDFPTEWDQGRGFNGCVWNAVGAVVEYWQVKQGFQPRRNLSIPAGTPGRMAGYYWTREMEGHVNQDVGCSIRDALKVLTDKGVCRQSDWGYRISRFRDKPNAAAVQEAIKHKCTGYSSLSVKRDTSGSLYVLDDMKAALASGVPFVVAFVVTNHLYTVNQVLQGPTGPITPDATSHAVVAVGYDDRLQAVKCRNSWGVGSWFWMPYALIVRPDFAFDMWAVEGMGG